MLRAVIARIRFWRDIVHVRRSVYSHCTQVSVVADEPRDAVNVLQTQLDASN